MEKVLEKTKRAVERYSSKAETDALKATRALWAAVVDCRQQIRQAERTERGVTKRMARELSDLLMQVPMLKGFLADKKALHRLHNRKLADAHIQKIESHLESALKELEEGKSQEIKDWVRHHPVLGELKKTLAKKLPESTYVLLFNQGEDGSPQLLTRVAADGRVFTRLRQREFKHDSHLHRAFTDEAALVGAAVIVDNKLHAVIGTVPQPTKEGQDQLKVLVSLSKEATSRPAREFIASNSVLSALHDMSKHRKIPKDGYILLFRLVEEDDADLDGMENADEAALAESASADEAADVDANLGSSKAESAREEDATAEEQSEEEPVDEQSVDEQSVDEQSVDEQAPPPISDEQSSEEAAPDLFSAESADQLAEEAEEAASSVPPNEATQSDVGSEEESIPADAARIPDSKFEILTRKGKGDIVLTRFYSVEFVDARKIYDSFAGAGIICGAAVIKDKELINVLGDVPQSPPGADPVQALLRASSKAVEKPMLDFIANNDVLDNLHKLANGDFPNKDAEVIVFVEQDAGRIAALPPPPENAGRHGRHDSRGRDNRGRENRGRDTRGHDNRGSDRDKGFKHDRGQNAPRGKVSFHLNDFKFAKSVRDRFHALPKVVGASVLGEAQAAPNKAKKGAPEGDKSADRDSGRDREGRDRDRDGRKRFGERAPRRSVVLAAFGKTPLKQNTLVTPEICRRLGIDIFN